MALVRTDGGTRAIDFTGSGDTFMTNFRAYLRVAGRALYGPRWQSEMARALGVGVRTVQRWDAGQHAPSAAAAVRLSAEIRELLAARRAEMRALERS